MSVEKIQLTMRMLENVPVFKDSPFTTKSVESAQPITSFKTNTALPAQLTQSTIKTPKLVIALNNTV